MGGMVEGVAGIDGYRLGRRLAANSTSLAAYATKKARRADSNAGVQAMALVW